MNWIGRRGFLCLITRSVLVIGRSIPHVLRSTREAKYNCAMRRPKYLAALIFAGLLARNMQPDELTTLIASPLTANTRPVLGTDGRLHLLYELVLTNTSPTTATPKKIEVLDGSKSTKTLASYQGEELFSHLRTMG